jgi:hypothetical protein
MTKSIAVAVLVASLCAFATEVAASENKPVPASSNFMLGQWARHIEDCRRPELTFLPAGARIAGDADGTPTEDSYSHVRYVLLQQAVTVQLGKPHLYSKTPDRKALHFIFLDPNTVVMSRSKKNTQFVRCTR